MPHSPLTKPKLQSIVKRSKVVGQYNWFSQGVNIIVISFKKTLTDHLKGFGHTVIYKTI
jgi:hypothetical protein